MGWRDGPGSGTERSLETVRIMGRTRVRAMVRVKARVRVRVGAMVLKHLADQASAVAIEDGVEGAARCMGHVGAGDEDVEVGDEGGAILLVWP